MLIVDALHYADEQDEYIHLSMHTVEDVPPVALNPWLRRTEWTLRFNCMRGGGEEEGERRPGARGKPAALRWGISPRVAGKFSDWSDAISIPTGGVGDAFRAL